MTVMHDVALRLADAIDALFAANDLPAIQADRDSSEYAEHTVTVYLTAVTDNALMTAAAAALQQMLQDDLPCRVLYTRSDGGPNGYTLLRPEPVVPAAPSPTAPADYRPLNEAEVQQLRDYAARVCPDRPRPFLLTRHEIDQALARPAL